MNSAEKKEAELSTSGYPVALVTGASRGVGASVATILAGRGSSIVVNYHSKRSRAEEVASAVRALGQRALLAQADLTSKVEVTSHMAHFYGDRGMSGPYEPVAASKYAGEQALRARRDEFEKRGVALVVVSGDMIEGTITPRLLERMNRGTTQSRRDEVGPLPTVEEFALAIADAATDLEPSSTTIFVGSTD